MGAKVVKKTAK